MPIGAYRSALGEPERDECRLALELVVNFRVLGLHGWRRAGFHQCIDDEPRCEEVIQHRRQRCSPVRDVPIDVPVDVPVATGASDGGGGGGARDANPGDESSRRRAGFRRRRPAKNEGTAGVGRGWGAVVAPSVSGRPRSENEESEGVSDAWIGGE